MSNCTQVFNVDYAYVYSQLQVFIKKWVIGATWAATPVLFANVSLGTIACLTIICIMPFSRVKTTPKIFYVAIAFFEVPPLLENSFFIFLLKTYLPVVSNRQVGFSLDAVSLFACQFSRFLEQLSSNAGASLTLFFAVQRLVVIVFPFKLHLFSPSRTMAGVLLIVLYAVSVNTCSFLFYGPSAADSVDTACAPETGQEDLLLAVYVINYMVPNFILLVVTILVTVALHRHRKSKLTQRVNAPGSNAARGVKTTVILVFIAACRCFVYLPWATLYIVCLFANDPFVAFASRIIANYFFLMCDLLSICDVCLYLKCIPDFRKRVFCKPTS